MILPLGILTGEKPFHGFSKQLEIRRHAPGRGVGFSKMHIVGWPRAGEKNTFRRDAAMYSSICVHGFQKLRYPEGEPADKLPGQWADAPDQLAQVFPWFSR